MIEAFIAIFIVASVTMFWAFLTLESDAQKKSYRPAYLLFISIVAWSTTVGLLVAPIATTTITYNGITANVLTTAVATTPSPFPTYAFYEYMAFSGAMVLIEIVFLVQYTILASVKLIGDGMDALK